VKICAVIYRDPICTPFVVSFLPHSFNYVTRDSLQNRHLSRDKRGTHRVSVNYHKNFHSSPIKQVWVYIFVLCNSCYKIYISEIHYFFCEKNIFNRLYGTYTTLSLYIGISFLFLFCMQFFFCGEVPRSRSY
jgi:hypothetical protein